MNFSSPLPIHTILSLGWTTRNIKEAALYVVPTLFIFLILNNKRNQEKSDKGKDLLFPLRTIKALSVGKKLCSKLLLCPPKFWEL